MMRITRLAVIGLACASLAASSQALACRASFQMRSFLFDALPEVPAGAVAARVEILSNRWDPAHPAIRARVISMLRGSYSGPALILEPKFASNCEVPPPPGAVGIVIGKSISTSGGVLRVEPVIAPGVPGWMATRH
jgi:hypothetical protein